MRFRSPAVDGVTVFAVAGVNTVSFGLRVSAGARRGLLGFAVQRRSESGTWRYIHGFKVFRSLIPDPEPGASHSTRRHPIQSLVWDDFTLRENAIYDYRFIPVRGTPATPRYGRPAEVRVGSEPLRGERHTVVFNRGVASSQAYERRFGGQAPDEQPTAAARQLALDWLSRDLDETFLAAIRDAQPGDALRGAFYEFSYAPVLLEFASALARGVDVKLVLDMKDNAHWENVRAKDGATTRTWVESAPREATLRALADAGIPDSAVIARVARPNDLQHNKFLVHLRSGQPAAVWTGSTNVTLGGIHGQSNVGHLVVDPDVAGRFLAYWELLARDLGSKSGMPRGEVIRANREFEAAVDALATVPAGRADIPAGITPVFSPRSAPVALGLYAELLAHPDRLACATFAFGIAKELRAVLEQGDENSPLRFFLLEKRTVPTGSTATPPMVELDWRRNTYLAWGSELHTALGQWVAETTTRELGLNRHVAFIHDKFLLSDPLGADPIVVTGSANFSLASSVDNDENMLIIRGDTRVSDIYFTEFNRLFFHYYFRSVVESTSRHDRAGARAASTSPLDLVEDDSWLANYAPGSLRSKRADQFVTMAGALRASPEARS